MSKIDIIDISEKTILLKKNKIFKKVQVITISTTTLSVHVNAAKEFKEKLGTLWFGLGGTTPWANEEQPNKESMYTTDLNNLFGMVQINKAKFVIPITSSNGTDPISGLPLPPVDSNLLKYGANIYQPISDSDIQKYMPREVYLEAKLLQGQLPDNLYRQIGIYEGVIPVPNKKTATVLQSKDISNKGTLDGYENIKFQRLDDNVGVTLGVILQF